MLYDIFEQNKVHQCPIGSLDTETCTCSSCYEARQWRTSSEALHAATMKNFAPTGSSMPINAFQTQKNVQKESTKEKYERQRKERYQELQKVDPDNMYWPPYNPLAKEGEKDIKVQYVKGITSIAVLSLEEAQEFYQSLGGKKSVGDFKTYTDLAKGGIEAYSSAKGLGGLGVKARTKNINGKDWIIIENFRRHQQTLMKGNKWGANNPKVIKIGLGLNDMKGAVRYVKFNVGIEVAFAAGVNAADYILRDDATLSEFVGNSSGDIVKGVLSLVGAAAITTALVPASAGVLATGIVFAIASFGLGAGIDYADELNGYTKDFTTAVKEIFE